MPHKCSNNKTEGHTFSFKSEAYGKDRDYWKNTVVVMCLYTSYISSTSQNDDCKYPDIRASLQYQILRCILLVLSDDDWACTVVDFKVFKSANLSTSKTIQQLSQKSKVDIKRLAILPCTTDQLLYAKKLTKQYRRCRARVVCKFP